MRTPDLEYAQNKICQKMQFLPPSCVYQPSIAFSFCNKTVHKKSYYGTAAVAWQSAIYLADVFDTAFVHHCAPVTRSCNLVNYEP